MGCHSNHLGWLALWEYESRQGSLPDEVAQASELEAIANAFVAAADVHKDILKKIPRNLIE
jgi:hypothetical protein